ncbi:flagellar biosynthetic protein FliP [bacterium DOLZORAL124_64_63]|nr:MAG: flagellar biosynthetic protein FliP [bacterium DOLZORAL124_64_63]
MKGEGKRLRAALFLLPVLLLLLAAVSGGDQAAQAASSITMPKIQIGVDQGGDGKDTALVLEIFLLFTLLSLAPAILIMMTAFTRIVIVLAVLRQAMGTQQMPPSQVVIGLSLFLTFFVMQPVLDQANREALQPYLAEEISLTEAVEISAVPLRRFMAAQTREKDLALFVSLARMKRPAGIDDIPFHVLIPAFVISELKTAFEIGFLLYVPFLIVDMVVASVLLSMGMMMLPPIMVSLPFKMMLFVLADGWRLIIGSLMKSFTGY